MLKISLLRLILAISGARQPKCKNEPPKAHSGYIWRQAAKILKMSLLRLILAISGARQSKCSKWWSFCLKEPKVVELLT